MIRTLALVVLAFLLAGCARFQSRGSPFATPPKSPPPPPYGSVAPVTSASAPPRPVGTMSPLGIASADPAPAPQSSEPALVPPKGSGIAPASGTLPAPDADANAGLPPFKRRPKPDELPPPFAPKEPPIAPPAQKAAPKVAPKTAPEVPAGPSPAAKNLGELKALLATASAAWKTVDTYEAVLTRREINPKGDQSNETVVYLYRREPMSVFMRTVSDSGKGREIVYFPTKHGDKMHVMLGEGDNRLVKAGFIAPPVSPDDPRVKEKARYSIRDAGFHRHMNTLGAAVAKLEAGKIPADQVIFDGEVKRPESAYPLVGVTHKLRPGDDATLPNGGTRQYFFDLKKDSPSFGMPVLVTAADASGKEAEYYFFDKIKSPAGLTDADFDPARFKRK